MGLQHLRESCPDWFEADKGAGSTLTGTARVLIEGAATPYVLSLEIGETNARLWATELEPRTRLPRRCPERHINAGGTFCTGYDAGRLPHTLDGARVWWGLLREYLGYQRSAERTGIWPAQAFIAHGEAGEHHITALEAARVLGLEDLYGSVLEGTPCWIDDGSIKVSKDGTGLLNGRAACPAGCRTKRGHRILRRKCCKRAAILALMSAERRRNEEEAKFWAELKASGAVCCGTMKNCPLRD